MPLTLVTTVGAASANSYITVAEADAYAAEIFPVTEVAPWLAGTEDDKHRALVTATRLLERERFAGDRVDSVQALAWPRCRAWKPSGRELYLTTEIPEPVKRAQARLAFWLLLHQDDPDLFGPADNAGVASLSLGSELSLSFEPGSSSVPEGERFLARTIRPILAGLVFAPGARAVRG